MALQPPKRISVPSRVPVIVKEDVTKGVPSYPVQPRPKPFPQKETQQSFPVDTEYSPEFTATKIPYNLRAAYVAYLQGVQVSLILKELDTFRCDQGEIKSEDHRLIKEARGKIDAFIESLARKLKLQS